uniref:Flippase n=1 Tax=candidate division WOR-3 bacterium TaxID=2052148 RepID=A0A7V3V0A7_UNCW3
MADDYIPPAVIDVTEPSYHRVALNTFFLSIADVTNKFLMFFFYVLAARHLGAGKFGILSFGFAFATMFSALTDLGLGAVAAREIARERQRAQELISNAVGIKLVVALLVVILISGLVNILGYPAENRVIVYICSLFIVETAFIAYFCYIFQGFQRMEFTALVRIIQSLILLSGVLFLNRISPKPAYYAWLYAGAGLITTVVGIIILNSKFVPLKVSFNLGKWYSLLLDGLPIGIGAIFVLFYYWNGSALLSKIAGDKEVGVYNAAFRLVTGLNFIGISFSSALYPVFSSLFTTNPARLVHLLTRALRLIIVMLLPVGVLGSLFAGQLIVFIYGIGYLPAANVLRILLWWAFATGFTSVFSNYFMATNRARWMTIQTAIALFVNVILNLILIPSIGTRGAAISIVTAEFSSLIFYIVVWQILERYHTASRGIGVSLLRVIGALLPAVVIARIALRIHVLMGLVSGLLFYLIVLIVLREFTAADLEIIRPFLSRLK